MKLRLIGFLFSLFLPLVASAQLGVYGEFSYAKASLTGGGDAESPNALYGGIGGFYFNLKHLVVLEPGIDVRFVGSYQTNSGDFVSDKLYAAVVGPRVAVRLRPLPLRPYVEGLLGVARSEGGGQNDSRFPNPSSVNFAYQIVVGADLTVLPRIDWRVAEYSFTGIPNQGLPDANAGHMNAISTGIVFRF